MTQWLRWSGTFGLTCFLLLATLIHTAAQSSLSLHPLVDTSQTDIRQAVTTWFNYLRSRSDTVGTNPYWNAAEQAEAAPFGGRFDLLEREMEPTLYLGAPVQVLSVVNYGGWYQIKSLLGGNNPKGKSPNLLAITNVYARPDNTGQWLLYNALPINRQRGWQTEHVGYVQYYFPLYHQFDKRKARQLTDFIEQLCRNFGVPPKTIEYYLTNTAEELRQVRGIDYIATLSGADKPTGRAIDNRVFCSGLDEFYAHEVIHAQLNPHFPNQHLWVAEGMATLFGGSRGQPLAWHLQRVGTYLKQHPEVDLNNLTALRSLDEFTDYRYALGGLICQMAYEKGGYPLLIQFMQAGRSDAAFYKAIDLYLGIPRNRLNEQLRARLP